MKKVTDQQKLVDIMFQLVLFSNESPLIKEMNREDLMAWTATQLRKCGFDAVPQGLSWGVLTGEGRYGKQ